MAVSLSHYFYILLVLFCILVQCICVFRIILFNFVNYVLLCTILGILSHCVVLCIVCKCVLYYCHRVSTQLQLTNIYQTHIPF
jgi:hypothetical protein